MNKLNTLAKNIAGPMSDEYLNFTLGFKEAFNLIDENLTKELNNLEKYPSMGERIMTLKIYKAKISGYLKEMEEEYE